MPDPSSSQDDPLRFRKKALAVGCIANIIVFVALAALAVIFLISIVRSLDEPRKDERAGADLSRSSAGIDQAVRAVLSDQVKAWNRGDLDAFMTGYWNNHELTFVSGDTVTKGWEATRDRYIKRYRSEGKEMGRLSFTELVVEPYSPTMALARGRYHLTTSTGTATGRFTLVFRETADGWRITSDHTSAAESPAGKKKIE
jgi:beta-aspartyl-peptidase (threonine type)